MFPKLEAEMQVEGSVIHLRTRPAYFLRRGVTLGILVPFLLGIIAVLLFAIDMVDEARPGAATATGIVLFVLVSLPCMAWGSILILTRNARSRATAVQLDLSTGIVTTANHTTASLSQLRQIRLHKPNRLLAFLAVDALFLGERPTSEAPFRPPTPYIAIRLWQNIPERRGAEILTLAQTLASHLGTTVEDSRSAFDKGLDAGNAGRTWHASAYLPFQGIFLFASVAILLFRRSDHLGRFHAKQSLILLAFETFAILFVLALGVPLLFISGKDPHPLGAVVLSVGLLSIMLTRLLLRGYASLQAWSGRPFLLPILGSYTKRWLPDPPA